jgi:hypothetical protein
MRVPSRDQMVSAQLGPRACAGEGTRRHKPPHPLAQSDSRIATEAQRIGAAGGRAEKKPGATAGLWSTLERYCRTNATATSMGAGLTVRSWRSRGPRGAQNGLSTSSSRPSWGGISNIERLARYPFYPAAVAELELRDLGTGCTVSGAGITGWSKSTEELLTHRLGRLWDGTRFAERERKRLVALREPQQGRSPRGGYRQLPGPRLRLDLGPVLDDTKSPAHNRPPPAGFCLIDPIHAENF